MYVCCRPNCAALRVLHHKPCGFPPQAQRLKQKDVQVPGALNRVFAFVTKMAPHGHVAAQIAKLYEGGLEK